jgi:hypothetical protein
MGINIFLPSMSRSPLDIRQQKHKATLVSLCVLHVQIITLLLKEPFWVKFSRREARYATACGFIFALAVYSS